jgi:hypothetical protein
MFGVVLYLSLLAFLYALVPNLIHRRQLDPAFESWHKNPTSQNEPFLRTQTAPHIIIQHEGSAIAVLVLWVAGFACYEIAHRAYCPYRQTPTRITSK